MSEVHQHPADHGAPGTEYDAPPFGKLAIWVVVLTVVVTGIVVGVVQYFRVEAEESLDRQENAKLSAALVEQRTREAELLSKGGKADDLKPGAVRAPIEKTIGEVAANPSLLRPIVVAAPPPPTPVPTPVPAPAPGAALATPQGAKANPPTADKKVEAPAKNVEAPAKTVEAPAGGSTK